MFPVTTALRVRSDAETPQVRIECVEDPWGFTALRPEWNELLRASGADCPFLTWEWLHTWWKHLGGETALRVVTVRAGQELIAIAPLRMATGRIKLFSRLEFLGTGHAGSDYLDVIIRKGREAEALRALVSVARSQQHTLRFDHLTTASMAAELVAPLAGEGWTSTDEPDGTCPFINLAGHTWDSYLGTLGSSHRANVRRRIKNLAQNFQVRFEPVTTESERREALAALPAFHDRRYATRGGSTAFSTPALIAFHDEVTRRALDRGWLRLYTLRLNDTLAAVMYGFSYNRRFYFYQHGFDEQFRDHSVGLALMGMTVRAAIDEGLQEFDLLWGLESYKALWTRDARLLRKIHLFPSHFGGRLHQRALEGRKHVRTIVRGVRPQIVQIVRGVRPQGDPGGA